MPKSRRRKGVKVAHTPNRRAALVEQRRMAMIVDDLDGLMRAVPLSYNPTDLAEAVEHHHHAAAVVAYMRDQRVVDLLAALAGGDMVVIPDQAEVAEAGAAGAAGQAEGDQGDGISYAEMVNRQLPTRTPGASVDGAGQTIAQADAAKVKRPAAMVNCGHCGGRYRARNDGRPYAHKCDPGAATVWCPGGGPSFTESDTPWAPKRTVVR